MCGADLQGRPTTEEAAANRKPTSSRQQHFVSVNQTSLLGKVSEGRSVSIQVARSNSMLSYEWGDWGRVLNLLSCIEQLLEHDIAHELSDLVQVAEFLVRNQVSPVQ